MGENKRKEKAKREGKLRQWKDTRQDECRVGECMPSVLTSPPPPLRKKHTFKGTHSSEDGSGWFQILEASEAQTAIIIITNP